MYIYIGPVRTLAKHRVVVRVSRQVLCPELWPSNVLVRAADEIDESADLKHNAFETLDSSSDGCLSPVVISLDTCLRKFLTVKELARIAAESDCTAGHEDAP